MKIYIKADRCLEGKQYLKGWHDVDALTASKLLEVFRGVCRLPSKAYGEGWRELRDAEHTA
jgi:hypothetical protein